MAKVSEEYKKLYHYTTWQGLLGILQTQTLWATHCRFLNDSSEIVLFRDKLTDFVIPVVKEEYRNLISQGKIDQCSIEQRGGLDKVIRHDIATVIDAPYKATGDEIYIVSFCKEGNNRYINHNGLLSQWRGYGVGGGIALLFDTIKLEGIIQKEANKYLYDKVHHLADVVYSDDDEKFKTELYSDVNNIVTFLRKCIRNIGLGKQEAPDGTKACSSFMQCISRYKHQAFKEENEVRIVCLPTIHNEEFLRLAKKEGSTPNPEKERKFRTKNGELVPYIELFDSTDIPLPIEKIIVGPHKEKDRRASALRVMLRNTNIEIIVSDIPYVD